MIGPKSRLGTLPARIVLAWAVLAAILISLKLPAIRELRFPDPDDELRLVQVLDLIGGQGWFDLTQYRIAPPGGVAMHWSRLVDLPIAATILALRPLLGMGGAQLAALVCVPLGTLLAAMALAGRVAGKAFGVTMATIVCLTWIVAEVAVVQFVPLRIDHHGWQVVAVLGAVNALVARSPRRGGWIAGGALGLGLSVSLELLPFAGLFAGVFGLRWLIDRTDRFWLVHLLQALAVTSAGCFLLTRGWVDIAFCDVVSPAYIAGFALAALLVTMLAAVPPLSRPVLAIGFAVAALACAGLYLTLAPQCTSGPFAQLDPLVRQVWYVNILEGQPIWKQPVDLIVKLVVPVLLGLSGAVLLWRRGDGEHRRFGLEMTMVLAGCLGIALLVARFGSVAVAVATIPLGWLLHRWIGQILGFRSPVRKTAAFLALIWLMMPGALVETGRSLAASFAPVSPAAVTITSATPGPDRRACGQPTSLQAFRQLPPGVVFAPLDLGPAILRTSPDRVVATGHHRGNASMHEVIAAFIATPDQARPIVARWNARYLVFCRDLAEFDYYRAAAPQGLAAKLYAGQMLVWLKPVMLPHSAGTLQVFRVIYPGARPLQPGQVRPSGAPQAARNSIASPFMQ